MNVDDGLRRRYHPLFDRQRPTGSPHRIHDERRQRIRPGYPNRHPRADRPINDDFERSALWLIRRAVPGSLVGDTVFDEFERVRPDLHGEHSAGGHGRGPATDLERQT